MGVAEQADDRHDSTEDRAPEEQKAVGEGQEEVELIEAYCEEMQDCWESVLAGAWSQARVHYSLASGVGG